VTRILLLLEVLEHNSNFAWILSFYWGEW